MSRYEWERGTIKLPAKEYPSFRKQTITNFNDWLDGIFKAATSLVESLRAEGKGKRNFDYTKAREAALERLHRQFGDDEEAIWKIGQLTKLQDGKPSHKPKLKDLGKLPISREAVLHLGEAAIAFNDKNKTVTWTVGENNHACERARSHPVARKFFAQLAKVNWTKGSGGTIVGNDEYNQESDYEGGGANYQTAKYGPKTKAEKEAEARARRSHFQSYTPRYGHYRRY